MTDKNMINWQNLSALGIGSVCSHLEKQITVTSRLRKVHQIVNMYNKSLAFETLFNVSKFSSEVNWS